MKKLLLLLTIVLSLFTIVYATEADVAPVTEPDASQEELFQEPIITIEDIEEDSHEGHDNEEVPTEGDTTGDVVIEDSNADVEEDSNEDHEHEHETTSNGGSTVIGAIIAIVVVVAVIALVALLQKK